MEINYSQHALNQLQQRNIQRLWVEQTLEEPELVNPDPHDSELKHAFREIPEKEFRVLKVVYNETTEPVTVVTAHFDRRMRGKL